MVLWQHVMLCGNKVLRVQLARCASYATLLLLLLLLLLLSKMLHFLGKTWSVSNVLYV